MILPLCGLLAADALAGHAAQVRQNAQSSPVVQALERYGNGEFEPALVELTGRGNLPDAARRFRREADVWVAQPSSDVGVRRVTIAATVALEIVARGVEGPLSDYQQVRPLVEWACELLRRQPPSDFEHAFHLASIALLQGAGDEALLVGPEGSTFTLLSTQLSGRPAHIRHGADRFPTDSRFSLALTTWRPEARIIASIPVSPGYLLRGPYGPTLHDRDPPDAERLLQDTLRRLGALITDPQVGHEARLRRGMLYFTMGQPSPAIPDLRAAAVSTDPVIRYLSHSMLGIIAERAGELNDAIGEYQAARRAVPAGAASTALAAVLFRQGRGSEAVQILSSRAGAVRVTDPWLQYGDRDYRLFPGYLAQMRALIIR